MTLRQLAERINALVAEFGDYEARMIIETPNHPATTGKVQYERPIEDVTVANRQKAVIMLPPGF